MTRWWEHPERGRIEVGDRDEAAAVCRNKLLGKTFTRYVRDGAKINPAPKPVTINPITRRDEWDLNEVRAWDAKRLGSGDWGGKGYHNRARTLGNTTTVEDVVTELGGEAP